MRKKKGAIPYGFYADEENNLIPLEDEKKVIRKIRRLRKKGLSYWKIAKEINDLGFKNRRGNPFSQGSVHQILKMNPLEGGNKVARTGEREYHFQKLYKDKGPWKPPSLDERILRTHKRLQTQCSKKGIPYELTFEERGKIAKSPCSYCGSEPENGEVNQCDRIIPSNGYVSENVQTLCKVCNRMKSNMTGNEFFMHIKKITNQRKK